MKLKMDTKFGEESTWRFKIGISNLINLTWALKSLKNLHFNGLLLSKVDVAWAKKSREELSFMTLQSDAKCDEKLTCCLKWEISQIFTRAQVSKLKLWWDPFVQRRKCMSLKFTEKLCVMKMKNDTKIEEELTCCFKIDMNFTNFDPSTRKV